MPRGRASRPPDLLEKAATGISGLDEITAGGLPRGRPTLVCGGAGCGKTLLALEFLVRGATEFGEPGVFIAFEETETELAQNAASLGFQIPDLIARKQLALDYVYVERTEIEESGAYTLDGLFVRLQYAIEQVKARRVVLDTIEVLLSSLKDSGVVRAELRRLFRWLKERGLTAIITAERGDGALTRHGLEEYVADCVILLDHRVIDQLSTRRMRIVKYRGTTHGTNEYPFLIGQRGISVFPITSLNLDHDVTSKRVSSGVPELDAMLGGYGYYQGSTVLISGTAGTGKSSLAAAFVDAACRLGERALYISFEESPKQIIRNMQSIGIDLAPWQESGLLTFYAVRPTLHGLELHLALIADLIISHQSTRVVIDPITSLTGQGALGEVKAMLTRLIDLCKQRGVTALLTSLTMGGNNPEQTDVAISSLVDAWLLLRNVEQNGERNRGLYVLKARGMAHSNQIREFRLSDAGIDLFEVYLGSGIVLTGAARLAQEARERAEEWERAEELARRERVFKRQRQAIEAQIAALHAELTVAEEDMQRLASQERRRAELTSLERNAISRMRVEVKHTGLNGHSNEET